MSFLQWRPAGLWRNPDFVKLWLGRTVSEFGSRITREGIGLTAVLVLGAGPAQMGVLGALASAPVLIVSLLIGVWVDRLPRRPVLMATDLARALLLATIPLAAVLGRLSIWQLYVVVALTGALAVIFEVADQSYLPSLVERTHLVEGNSKLGASESLAEMGGPALAGGLVQVLTAPIAIAFDALSFLVSVISVWLIRKPEPRPAPQPGAAPGLWSEIAGGLGLVWRDPLLRSLTLTTTTRTFFGNFIGALYSFYLVRNLGITPALLGILISLGGVGALPGTVLAGPAARRFGLGRTLVVTMAASSLLTFLIPLAPGPGALAILCLATGQLVGDCLSVIYAITEVSLRQTITPDRLLGRMNASVRFMVGGLSPLGALLGGALGARLGARPTLFVAALGCSLATAWLIWSPIRQLREVQAPSEVRID